MVPDATTIAGLETAAKSDPQPPPLAPTICSQHRSQSDLLKPKSNHVSPWLTTLQCSLSYLEQNPQFFYGPCQHSPENQNQ